MTFFSKILAGCCVAFSLLQPSCKNAGGTDETLETLPPAFRASALDDAHASYLDGDYLGMVRRIRDVLADESSDELVKDNARELLEKGYEATGGHLPADWKLPPGFEGIAYKQIRGAEQDGLRYRIRIDGRIDDGKRIAAIRLARGSEVLLDSSAHRGAYFATPDDDGMTYFFLESPDLTAFPDPGVFTLRITMADGSVTEGWFVSERLASSAAPVVTAPGPSDSVVTGHPTITWAPFHSPEFAAYERRSLILWLSRRRDDGSYETAWSNYQGDAGDRTEARVGIPGQGHETTTLVNGDYAFAITYGETRRFGPIALIRASRRNLSFHVARE